MTVKSFDFEIVQQQTHDFEVEFYDSDNLPRAMTGFDFKLDAKINPNTPETVFSLTSSSGQITIDGTDAHKLHLLVDHSMSKQLSFTKAYYDLILFDTGRTTVEVIMSGTVTLTKTITRLP